MRKMSNQTSNITLPKIYSSVLEKTRIDSARDTTKIRFAFFGSPRLAAVFLDDLEQAGYIPSLVVTSPDQKAGRGMKLSPTPVKLWAEQRNIEVLQPERLDDEFNYKLRSTNYELFVVIYYGKILPRTVLGIPRLGALNIHFSLLPRWRGTSPVRAAILNDNREIGTSIIRLDEKIDHGPVVAQKKIPIPNWPIKASELEERMTHESAKLLADILQSWIKGEIEAHEQNHDLATHCPTLTKKDGLINLSDNPYQNLLKIRAFDTTIGTYTFFERSGKRIRVQILDAHLDANERLTIDRVKPEGKREMTYDEFLRSAPTPIEA